jgi:hypothetical protein
MATPFSSSREILNARIGFMLHQAFVDIRNLSYPVNIEDEPDRLALINAIADLMHNLPRFMVGFDPMAVQSEEDLQQQVAAFVQRCFPESELRHHYMWALTTPEAELWNYCRNEQIRNTNCESAHS